MVKFTYPYITINICGNIGDQLFKIAHIITFIHNSKKINVKRKLVFCDNGDSNESGSVYWNTMFKGLFRVLDKDLYDKIMFYKIKDNEDESNYFNKAILDIELNDSNCQTFNYMDDRLRDKMINIVYNNEDIMYTAYYKYRDALDFFGKDTKDDDMVSLHITKDFSSTDEEYYKEALKISGKRNVIVFTDDIDWFKIKDIADVLEGNKDVTDITADAEDADDTADEADVVKNASLYNFYYVPKSDTCGDEIDFVLMSMFKNNIIANSTYSLWASYISYYDEKIIIAPEILACKNKDILHKYISHII